MGEGVITGCVFVGVWGGVILGCVFVGKRRALGASGLEVGVGPGLKPNQF